MSESLKIKPFILILIAGILLTSSTSMPLANAQPTPTSLTIDVPFAPKGKECTMEATLKDENNNPLQNVDIDFLYACDGHTHLLGTAKTDSNGVASLTYTFFADTWKISANFNGTTSYVQSSSEYVTIIIIDRTPHLVSGGIIAVSIIAWMHVVGYFVFRARRR